GDAVAALEPLGARGPEAEDDPAVGEGVEPGGGHGEERRWAGVDRQDRRADLDALGLGGDVAHEADAVEAVGLGDPDRVEAGLLERGDPLRRLLEAAGVAERHAEPQVTPSPRRAAAAVDLRPR